MSDATPSQYFYMAGGKRRGPFEQLLQQPIHRQTPVWSKGMSDWQPAQDVPGLADLIPPPPPAGAARPGGTPDATGRPLLERYADALRRLNISLLILIGGTLVLGMLSGNAFGVVYLIAAVAWVLVMYQAATAVPVNLPWLWAIGGVLPIVSYVPLIVLHNKLKKPLEAAGYRISFLGRATPPAGVGA